MIVVVIRTFLVHLPSSLPLLYCKKFEVVSIRIAFIGLLSVAFELTSVVLSLKWNYTGALCNS